MKWKKDIYENVRSGIVELLVLHLLRERDMYGYELRNTLAKRTNHAFDLKDVALYGPLYRMNSRGLVSSHRELVGERRFRVYYHIEEAGQKYLDYGEEQIQLVFSGIMNLFTWNEEEEHPETPESE